MSSDKETFCQRVVDAASIRQDKVAMMLIEPEGISATTFGSMLAQVRSLSYRLCHEGIAFGERIAIIGENHPNWAIAYLGIIYRGAVVVPLDPAATAGALAAYLKDSDTKLAFVSPSSLEKFRAACDWLGRSIRAVAMRPLEEPDGLACFDDWVRTPAPPEFINAAPPARPEDMAVLIYTSGTTGVPKAVPLTHGNIYAESDKVEEVMKITDREVVLSLLPLFHAYSQIVNLWIATIIGARVVYLTELTSTEIERGLKEGGATALLGVPRLWYLFHKKIFDAVRTQSAPVRLLFRMMLAVNGGLRDWIGINAGKIFFRRVHQSFGGRLRLAVSAGASFDEDVAKDFHRLGFTILQGYGLTETAGAATVTRFEDNKIGSVGTPLNGVEVKIDEPGAEGIGEVLIRGPIVMQGYYHNPDANREAFTADGWFRSGDLGRFDSQGHLYIVGRKKDVIKLPSGKNVFPEDVEAHYERSAMVNEICVLGINDVASGFKRGEKLCAVVVPDFDYLKIQKISNTREAIRFELENLGRELPEYQRVHDFIIRAEPLPRTTTRKVRRFELRDQLEESTRGEPKARKAQKVAFTATDRALMDSTAGRALVSAIKQHAREAEVIHPQMNLEIDLGLDSLARAECMVSIEQTLCIELEPEEAAAALKVSEIIELANSKINAGRSLPIASQQASGTEIEREAASAPLELKRWHEILAGARLDVPEIEPLLKPKRLTTIFAYLVLRLVYICARLLFRMEVKGSDVLRQLKPPFIICPNHQSYLDPFLVCSVYPANVLKNIFHVGASMYFTSFAMSQLARVINVVPIDPDANLLRAIRAAAAGLRAGKILNIYPEGERAFDGNLHEFKKGAAILATELNLPLVPVAIDGAYRIWPRRSWRIRLAKVKIRFGDVIDAGSIARKFEDEEIIYDRVTEVLEENIQRMLDEMRKH